jgi:peptidoglycan/LPS O-acetylase OafA/YrhL
LALFAAQAKAAATNTRGKLTQLEALRGVAAVIVVAWHFLWAFDPAALGMISGYGGSPALVGSVAMAPIDGPAAVTLFFVLSGFVLPLGYFHSGRTEIVVRAAAKRWLRLVCLTLLAVMLSYLLFRFGLYRHREAGVLTGSAWLTTFGGDHPHLNFHPSFFSALSEGTFLAFLHEPDNYVPMLWTMHHEFIGSFLTLFLAVVMARTRVSVALWVLLGAAMIVQFTDPWLIAFVAGTGLAWLMSRLELRLPAIASLAAIALGVFLFGYLEPTGAYAQFPGMYDAHTMRYDRISIHTVSALLIMVALLGGGRLGQVLAFPVFRLLGRLSFPVYLFHFPLMCSLASGLFVLLRPGMSYAETVSVVAAVYGIAVLGVAYLFARVDETWLSYVNTFSARLLRPRPAV